MEESPFVELESNSPKSKRWVIILEKIVAGFLIFYGLALIISILAVLFSFYHRDYFPESNESGVMDYIVNYSLQIIYSILTIYAGILLMFKRKLGWVFTMAVLSVLIVFILYILYVTKASNDLVIGLFFLIIPCACLFFITRKAVLQRYGIGKREYATAGAIVVLLILLRFLLLIF